MSQMRIKIWFDKQPGCPSGWCAERYEGEALTMTSEGWAWPVPLEVFGPDDGEAVKRAVAEAFPQAEIDFRE